MLPLILDVAIILALVATLVAGYRLHGRLRLFRAETEEFEPLIQALDHAARRAGTVLAELRRIADDVGTKLNAEAANTQRLLDELDFMTKRADQLAGKLDDTISQGRKQETRPKPVKAAAETHGPQEALAAVPGEQRRRAPDLEKRLKTLR
jgi:hypothetical protein